MKKQKFAKSKQLLIFLFTAISVCFISCMDSSLAEPKSLIVILKADDLGETYDNWNEFIKIVNDSGACAGIGIISKNVKTQTSLNEIRRVSALRQSNFFPVIEFWNHGWDHEDIANGTEFKGTDFKYQFEHLKKAQDFFKDSLHIICHSFGAPHNRTSPITLKVLEKFKEIHVWQLFRKIENETNKPWIDPDISAFKPSNNRLMLNIDYLYLYDFKIDRIIPNYKNDLKKPYIIIQLHPMNWDTQSFENFKEMIHFYKEKRRGVFMTPYQYYKYLKKDYISE